MSRDNKPSFEFLGIRRTEVEAEKATLVTLVKGVWQKPWEAHGHSSEDMKGFIARLEEGHNTVDASNARTALGELEAAESAVKSDQVPITNYAPWVGGYASIRHRAAGLSTL